MSKEGSLARIAKYKRLGKSEMLANEEAFYRKNFGELELAPEPEKEKSK